MLVLEVVVVVVVVGCAFSRNVLVLGVVVCFLFIGQIISSELEWHHPYTGGDSGVQYMYDALERPGPRVCTTP